jgi:hypothetical protein
MGWMIRVLGFDCWWGLGIFLFTTVSRTALGPTQPPIQWVPGLLSLGVKQLRHEADHSPPSSAKVKNAWSYTSTSPICLHGWCLVKHRDKLYLYLLHPVCGFALSYVANIRIVVILYDNCLHNIVTKSHMYGIVKSHLQFMEQYEFSVFTSNLIHKIFSSSSLLLSIYDLTASNYN